jgi:DNA polymerase/3'-5' exonuclease PolX
MPMLNVEIANRFEEIADVLDVQSANAFRVRAYRNAARVLRAYGDEMSDLVARGVDLKKLPSIGHDLALCRGWLERKDVVNTRPLSELRKLLKATTKSGPRCRLSGSLSGLRRSLRRAGAALPWLS